MTTSRIAAHALRFGLCCFAGSRLVALAQQPEPEMPQIAPRDVWIEMPAKEELPRHFRIGALVGVNIKASFSMSGQFGVSGSQPGQPGQPGLPHVYDDGYVLVDETGNAQGYTSYWGYNNANQYNAGANTLTFHSTTSFNTSGSEESVSDSAVGLDVAYGGQLWRVGPTRIGWELGFGFLPMAIKDKQPMSVSVTRTVHQFSTAGIEVLPSAPYNGGSSGIGPTIHDTANPLPDDATTGAITGTRTLDVTLYAVTLGPMLHWELSRRWAVSVSGGPALGIVSGDLEFDETLALADGSSTHNKGKFGGTDTLFGGYVNATLMFHAEDRGDFYIGAQYMPLGTTQISGGGRQSKLDLSRGVYFSAGINWPF